MPPSSTPVTRLTVVMAAYNESATIQQAIDGVLGVEIPNVELDLVIIESNSTDGTREIVRQYQSNSRVTVEFEDTPRGKGAAVRRGLAFATGDIVLIQDADLEYSFDDYGALVFPIINGDATFVLGTRHDRNRAMRHFEDAQHVSRLMNAAHGVFTWLFNFVYRTRLTDPFTMYKVVRRDSLNGLTFTSDRFDFDWELVAKLVRTGHVPVEVPVKYESRGYSAGKKVRFFRDPVTWIIALVKFRFVRIK